MKIQRGIINKTIIAICSLALSFCTGIHAEELRLTNSNGIITINTNDGSVTIDTDDIEDNAQALDALEGQLNNIYFKYESGYYWAKSSADSEWEKIGAVGNTEPWMVLKNTGDKDITFSSQSGVDIAGAMENYAGNKELLVTSDATLSNIGGTDCLSLEVPSTGYYTASGNALGADTTKLNYALSKLGDAGVANVLDGKYFTSSVGIRTKGSMANHSEDVTNKNSNTGYLPKNGANYLSVTVPYTGYYTDATKLITGVKYNPTGRVSQMPNKQTIDQNIGNANPNLASSVLKLGMNQSLTIPAGYYSNDIVIDNGAKYRGGSPYIGSGQPSYNIKNIRSDWDSLTNNDFLVVLSSNFSAAPGWENWGGHVSKGSFGGMSLTVNKSYRNGILTVDGTISYRGDGCSDHEDFSHNFNKSYNINSALTVYCLK